MIAECHSLPNIYDMLKAKVERSPGKLILEKKHLTTAFSWPKNRHHLILGGPGGQTIDSRSTSGLPLETSGSTSPSEYSDYLDSNGEFDKPNSGIK